MNIKKYIAALTIFSILSFMSPVMAAEAVVYNTGDGLNLKNDYENSNSVSVNNSNKSDLTQRANAEIYTGGNSYERNIAFGGGMSGIQSGNAYFAADFSAPRNSNATSIDASGGGGYMLPSTNLVNTGDNTSLQNRQSTSSDVSVTNDNHNYVYQEADLKAVTGNNTVSRNIGGGGGIMSGDASFDAIFRGGGGNQNATHISSESQGNSHWMPEALMSIFNTGDGLRYSNDFSQKSRVDVNNYSHNNTEQKSYFEARTGSNRAQRSLADSSVRSGEVYGSTYFDGGDNTSNWTLLDNSFNHLMNMWHNMY